MAQPEGTKRYRAGFVPHYAPGAGKPKEDSDKGKKKKVVEPKKPQKADRRLARLQKHKKSPEVLDDEERLDRHRRLIHEAEVIEEEEEIKKEEEPPVTQEEDVQKQMEVEEAEQSPDEKESSTWNPSKEEDREKLKETLREEENVEEPQQESALPFGDEEGSKEESDEDSEFESYEEYSSSEGEDFFSNRPAVEPIFIPKEKRQTLNEKDREELEAKKLEEQKEERKKVKRSETLTILKEEIKRDMEKDNANADDDIKIDDDDEEENVEREYELWKIRELKRIKRERESREKFQREKEDIDRRRKMTDQEVMMENRKDPEKQKIRRKMKFLQKYYHSGAFFVDELKGIKRTHDFSAAVGEDKYIDRTSLPKVMQVKNFGRAGRTKYTHLVAEDTTFSTDNPWAAPNETRLNYMNKMGGLKDTTFDRPSLRRRKK